MRLVNKREKINKFKPLKILNFWLVNKTVKNGLLGQLMSYVELEKCKNLKENELGKIVNIKQDQSITD